MNLRRLRGRLLSYAAAWIKPESALIVPVPAAEQAVARSLGRARGGTAGLPLHVTLMYPFLRRSAIGRREESALAELARSMEPFDFGLARLDRFPGVHYLAPESPAPFLALTKAIQRSWPSCAPYRGAYDQVIPHVTVFFGPEPPAGLDQLAQLLPIHAQASEVCLIEQSRGRWRVRRRFPLGAVPQ